MFKIKKIFLGFALVAIIIFSFLSCGEDDNNDNKTWEPIWTWETYDDPDDYGFSNITLSGTSEPYTISGYVSLPGFVGWRATPNATTLAALRSATSISFKIKSNRNLDNCIISLPTTSITDYSYYGKEFSTTKDIEKTVTVKLSDFYQPGWSKDPKPFIKSEIQKIQWQIENVNGTFSLTICDLVINK